MILVDVRVLQYPRAAQYVNKLASLEAVVFVNPESALSEVAQSILDNTSAPLVQPSSKSTLNEAEFWLRVFSEYKFSSALVTEDPIALASSFVADTYEQPTIKILYDKDVDVLRVV